MSAPPDTSGRDRPGSEWRDEVASASGLNVIAGLWLVVSPFVLGYGADDPVWNPVTFGALLLLLALIRVLGAYRQTWMSGLNVVIGGWIFASAFWLAHTTTAAWNDLIAGAVVMGLALWSMGASSDADGPRRSRASSSRGGFPPPTGA